MSSITSRKKRPGLLEVVNRLSVGVSESKSEDIECDEELQESKADDVKRRASASSFHLAKAYVPPTSPQSNDSSDEKEEKEVEEVRKGPTEPMRCGVCGLRVYKSYRYISRTSAPNHLKNFFDPDTDRFRVCKRCHSSKERCRQNLSLLLLKSETEQYVHLRSPLGITHHRRSHSMKFLTRDIGRSLKRPYEDLMCDETFDEDYLSDADESTLSKALDKDPLSAKNMPSNGCEKSNGIGVVSVVRPASNNVFVVYPNHFTTYGEITKSTEENGSPAKTELTTIKIFNKKPEEKITESEDESVPETNSTSGELKSEIRTINYKLTLLDHAYALPAAKNVKLVKTSAAPKPVIPNKVPKVIKTESLAKTAIKNMIKNNNQSKKKEATSTGTSTENKDPPARTCGIICSLCSNLVTKSYSCYRKENAPEKIRPLFTGDVKVMKVCRRCVPYKKPKGAEEAVRVSKSTKFKVSMNKFVKQKVKNAKKAVKFDIKNNANNENATQTKMITKTVTIPNENLVTKEPEKPQDKAFVQVSPRKDTKMVHVSIKNGKVESSTNNGPLNAFPPITANGSEGGAKTQVLGSLQEKINTKTSVVFLKLKGLDTVAKQPIANVNNQKKQVDVPPQPDLPISKKQTETHEKEETKGTTEPQNKDDSCDKDHKDQEVVKFNEVSDNKTEEVKDVSSKENKPQNESPQDNDKTASQDIDNRPENKEKHTKEAGNEMEPQSSANSIDLKPAETKQLKTMKAPVLEPVRSSPRRDKNIVPPEKKKDSSSDSKPSRKRKVTSESESEISGKRKASNESESESNGKRKVASESEGESTGKQNRSSESDGESTGKRKGNEPNKQNEEKSVTKKTEETSSDSDVKPTTKSESGLKRSTRKGRGSKRKDSDSSNTSNIDADKKEKKTKVDDTKDNNSSRSNYSTRYGQSPTKCCCCSEGSQKLFRCVQNGRSPAHIKPLFEREGTSTLGVCRKCLNSRARVKSFL